MTQWGIDTLFNPGKRHMDEEKRRLQSTREEVGDSSGGRRIDFESGTVTISRRGKAAPPADPASESGEAESDGIQAEDETEPAEAQASQAEADQAEADQAEADQAEADQAEAGQAEAGQAEADQAEAGKAG